MEDYQYSARHQAIQQPHFAKVTEIQLMFTGWRRQRRYLTLISQAEVWLPYVLFVTLAELAFNRLTTLTGATKVSSLVAFRLRKEIQSAASVDGPAFVESCGSSEYCLCLNKDGIQVDETFFRLERQQVLPTDYFSVFVGPKKT